MTDAGWAERAVDKVMERLDCSCKTCAGPGYRKLLKSEHARSVRIVKAEIKRVKMDQHTYRSEERCLVLGSLETVLNALQRGRGGKG